MGFFGCFASTDAGTLFDFFGGDAVEEVPTPKTSVMTPNGTIELVHQITLGDLVVTTSISLLVLLLLLRWLLDTIWRRKA